MVVSLDDQVVVLSVGDDEYCHVADSYVEWVINSAASYCVNPRYELFILYKSRDLVE
jgi:hypothetical protein